MILSCPGPETAKEPRTTMLPPPRVTVTGFWWCADSKHSIVHFWQKVQPLNCPRELVTFWTMIWDCFLRAMDILFMMFQYFRRWTQQAFCCYPWVLCCIAHCWPPLYEQHWKRQIDEHPGLFRGTSCFDWALFHMSKPFLGRPDSASNYTLCVVVFYRVRHVYIPHLQSHPHETHYSFFIESLNHKTPLLNPDWPI